MPPRPRTSGSRLGPWPRCSARASGRAMPPSAGAKFLAYRTPGQRHFLALVAGSVLAMTPPQRGRGAGLWSPPTPPGLTDCGERWGEPRAEVPGGTPVWEVGIARAPGPRLPRRRRTIVPGSLSQLQSETFLHPPPPEPGLGVTFGTISAKKSAPDRRFCDSMEMKRH